MRNQTGNTKPKEKKKKEKEKEKRVKHVTWMISVVVCYVVAAINNVCQKKDWIETKGKKKAKPKTKLSPLKDWIFIM